MKKIVSLGLVLATIFLLVFSLASCEPAAKEVESINGKAPEIAFEEAMEQLVENPNYTINIDLSLSVLVGGMAIEAVGVNDFFIFKFDGENTYFAVSESAKSSLESFGVGDVLRDIDDESWYVDGVIYERRGDEKIKYTSEKNGDDVSNVFEDALSEVVDENKDKAKCYVQGDRAFFTVELTDAASMKLGMDAEKELYKVYISSDGKIDEIVVECTLASVGVVKLTAEYDHSNISITPPKDISNYIEK